jgi:hypothetical protein
MPAELIEDPLGIGCVFSSGTRITVRLSHSCNPQMERDLLAGLAGLVHPHGDVDAENTVRGYTRSIQRIAKALTEAGHAGGASGLSRARLAEYWMGAGHARESTSRRMLAAFDASTGALRADVRELVSGRHFNPGRNQHDHLPPYSEGEWARLEAACRSVVRESFAAHRQVLAAARRGGDPRGGGWTHDNICWLLAENGPLSGVQAAAHMQVHPQMLMWYWGPGRLAGPRAALFPPGDIVLAYRLLFGVLSGIVPDGIEDLNVRDVDWAGDATVLLSYVKGRTAAESVTLGRPAVRLLEQWLEHSALLRQWAPTQVRGDLWLRLQFGGIHNPFRGGPFARNFIPYWAERHELRDDRGDQLVIHRHRIRTTFESHRDRRAWFGSSRATIDPNHSPQVEGDHYLTVTTGRQRAAVEEIITQAQGDLLRRAHPLVVLAAGQAAELAAGFPELVTRLKLDDTAIAELTGGQRDVFTAACGDPLAGLHGPPGKPCPARPWVCLLCPLAVFSPRHAANLLRLKAFFARQWKAMPAQHFMAVFGPYAVRIDEVTARFDPALLASAAAAVADADEEIPLRPEERTG